jgi:hypothetical protein
VHQRLHRAVRTVPPAIFVGTIALLLTIRFLFIISRYSVNVLFGDQWDFLSSFFDHDPTIAELFFWQHGPHREGIGLIADKFLYPLTAWNVRAECFLIGGCIIAAMLLALLLKRRLFGQLQYSDAIIPMIFLTLAQYETVLITPNPAYSGFPLLLLMLYLLALLQNNGVVRYGLVLIVNFLLIYTGFGVFMGVITIGLFALACYRSLRGIAALPLIVPAAGLLIACVSLASFFHRYRFEPAVDCFVFPYHPLVDYPWFVALMFSTFAGLRSPIVVVTILGTILLGVAVYIFGVELRRSARADSPGRPSAEHVPNTTRATHLTHVTIAILVGYSLLYAANTSVGRVCLGLPAPAQSSRYMTLLIPAFLAMYFYLLALPSKKLRDALVIALAMVLIPGQVHLSARATLFADGKRAWANCYKRTEDIAACDAARKFKIYPDPERTRLKQKLDYLQKNKLNLFAE